MIESSCHCGAVRLSVDADPPTVVTDCNCSICRRYGALWSYYSPTKVRIEPPEGATEAYVWGDHMLEFHRCKGCGCLTHWASIDRSHDRMGVNVRLMDLDILEAVQRRRLDGARTGQFLD